MTCANKAQPLLLPWSNVTVSADGLAVTRGIEVGIGSPNQIFSFRPSSTLNNTRIYNVLDCGSVSNTTCVGSKGGVFDSSKSSTYAISIKDRWNGSTTDAETATGSYVYFNDDIAFQRNGSVDGFPLVMDSELGQGAQSGLPMGLDSSFLAATVDSGVAPSKAWGLWAGSRSLNPVDGLLVIGGYDTSRVAGNFTTFPIANYTLAKPCPLQVTVTNITYDYPGWPPLSVSLFDNQSQTLTACIEPFQHSFSFPPDITQNFARVTGYNTSYPPITYPATSPPSGNLTITLDNGYKTVVTHEEFVTLKRGSDANGRYAITNASIVETEISNNLYKDPATVLPVLGGTYLTFNYLVVDYEQQLFRLAPAKQGTADPDSLAVNMLCTPAAEVSSSPTPTAAAPVATSSTPPASHTKVGAIAGGVVGGVLGLALIVGIIAFFLVKRRRKARKDDASNPGMLQTPSQFSNGRMSNHISDATELPSPDHHVSEWLSGQPPLGLSKEAQSSMSATVNAPVEMPAFSMDDTPPRNSEHSFYQSPQHSSQQSPQQSPQLGAQTGVPRNSIPRKPVRGDSLSRFVNYGQPSGG